MCNVQKVLKLFEAKGTVKHVLTAAEADYPCWQRPNYSRWHRPAGFYVYMVYNGEEIPQIGYGTGPRLTGCMRGTIAIKHNKAFICALTETIFGQPNRYCYVSVKSEKDAQAFEKLVHEALGIRTNKEGATVIEGVLGTTIKDIHQALWNRIVGLPIYRGLDEKEKMMAEELFELVTYATTKITRPRGNVTKSRQGDNLEGNILMNVDKAYLIDIYQKLTKCYHRYGKHKLSDEDFYDIKRNYSYTPKHSEFDVS